MTDDQYAQAMVQVLVAAGFPCTYTRGTPVITVFPGKDKRQLEINFNKKVMHFECWDGELAAKGEWKRSGSSLHPSLYLAQASADEAALLVLTAAACAAAWATHDPMGQGPYCGQCRFQLKCLATNRLPWYEEGS